MIVAIDAYRKLPRVRGAVDNARAWHVWLTEGRGLQSHRARLLTEANATAEGIRRAVAEATKQVEPGGTLWFVFIGHGYPERQADAGRLVGADARPTDESLRDRSLRQAELLELLQPEHRTPGRTVVVLDACFSGRAPNGELLARGTQPLVTVKTDPGPVDVAWLTATSAADLAGALPGASRPAFSYLVLGALRGWGSDDGVVTGVQAVEYARETLVELARGSGQRPEARGRGRSWVLADDGREVGPDRAAFARMLHGQREEAPPDWAGLPEVPVLGTRLPRPVTSYEPAPLRDLSDVDVEAEGLLDAALEAEQADQPPAKVEEAWCALARVRGDKRLRDVGKEACGRWQAYRRKRTSALAAMAEDRGTLEALLSHERRTPEERLELIEVFLKEHGGLDADEVGWARNAWRRIAWERACREGSALACFRRGVLSEQSLWAEPDQDEASEYHARAVEGFGPACKAGDGEACRRLGRQHLYARGVAIDQGRARALFARGCDVGSMEACVDVALHDESGATTRGLLDRACRATSGRACVELADRLAAEEFRRRPALQPALLERSCRAGAAWGCDRLFEFYPERAPDWEHTALLYRHECERGEPESCYMVNRDDDACAGGSPEGCHRVGRGHYQGRRWEEAIAAWDRGCRVLDDGAACRHLADVLGKLRREPDGSLPALDRGCSLGDAASCSQLIWLIGISDPTRTRSAYARGCAASGPAAGELCYRFRWFMDGLGGTTEEKEAALARACQIGGHEKREQACRELIELRDR